MAAILGYPLYSLGRLSLQQYGLFELVQHKGKYIGLDNFRSGAPRPGVLAHARAHDRLHDRECRADDGDRRPARAAARPGQHVGADRPDLGARARVVDAAGRRRPGLAVDDELPERRRQLRPDRAPLRRLLPPRLVRVDVLAAEHRHRAHRLGRGAVRRDHVVRGAVAGAARADRGRGDRRRALVARVLRRRRCRS